MTTSFVAGDQNLEKHIHKQMGCMAGFLQIFDRHQILSPKRIYSTKRLPPPPSPMEKPAAASPPEEAQPEAKVVVKAANNNAAPALPVLEFKEGTRSSWKFSREAPRLSLDSRAVVDAKGSLHPRETRTDSTAAESDGDKQRRSTSVIARLMGLDPIPDSDPEPSAKLRRSASESRVPRDLPLPQSRFFESKPSNFQQVQENNVVNAANCNGSAATDNRLRVPSSGGSRAASVPLRQRGTMTQKKSFYDATDFFPEPKDMDAIYGVIERRLRMRGINQPSQDLHTLKNILEALQLKGLLHSEKPNQSPIVVMKPVRSSGSIHRTGCDSPPPRSSLRSSRRSLSPSQSERNQARARNLSPNRRKVESQRKVSNVDGGGDSRRVSPVHSPKISSRRNPANQITTCGSSSPRLRKAIDPPKMKVLGVAEDESSTVSENSFSTSSHTDTERYKMEEYREGKNLLDRCDKLLNSIAEITAANELQPSPVSVLDSSFYKDEWCSPSPIPKRCIDYKDQAVDSEDDMWSSPLCGSEGKSEEAASTEDSDLVYASEILRACSYLPEESDVFVLLEKQQCRRKGKDAKLQRRLIFDTLQEILNRNQQLPPWKKAARGEEVVWSEFRRIREREESESSEDLFGVICSVLRKDMAAEMGGWGEWPVEMGDVVLDIERLVFKDLIGETIQLLASISPQCNSSNRVSALLRRKLVF